jgi:hypothetical protein
LVADPQVIFHEQLIQENIPIVTSWASASFVAHKGYVVLPPERRNGKEFWKTLVKRLETVLLVQHWSSSQMISYESGFTKPRKQRWEIFTRDPEGSFSTLWNLLQLVLLTYVAFSVPYFISFDDQFAEHSFGWIFELIVDIYFIVVSLPLLTFADL